MAKRVCEYCGGVGHYYSVNWRGQKTRVRCDFCQGTGVISEPDKPDEDRTDERRQKAARWN